MKSIPLTRVRHASNFVLALEDKGIDSERILRRANLSTELLGNLGSDGVISAISMLDFAEQAAYETGITDLGYFAGSVPVKSYGEFGKHVATAPTLYIAIMTYCNEVQGECSAADYYLAHDETNAWFCHGPVDGDPARQSQHELYALMIMTQVIQLALGADWQPELIRLQTADEHGIRDNSFLVQANIEFSTQVTAVGFPIKYLAEPLGQKAYNHFTTDSNTVSDNIITLPLEPLAALKKLIITYIRQSKYPSIDVAAELTGVSKRTLQRFLKSKSTSYSNLIDQVRFNLAIPLLKNNTNTISEISNELGYANVAHFSRAFKRLTGLSPRAYRQILNK